MKKYILDLELKENRQISSQYFLLILTSNEPLPEIHPGQFAEIRVEDSSTTFLRRPFSIHFVDYNLNEMWILIQVLGDGTRHLSRLKKGQILNLILPLGNRFSIPNEKSNALLIGGGCGVAPLLYLGYELYQKGVNVNFLLGARSQRDILQKEEYLKYGNLYLTTEDGTLGEKGFVTNHSILKNNEFTHIYSCGPTPMMKAVAKYATDNNLFCEVSLENTMACGIGACLCCVTDTIKGHLCVCTDGPIFNIKSLKW